MAKLVCTATTYMPTGPVQGTGRNQRKALERYEDYNGNERDVYEVNDADVPEFLATGNFVREADFVRPQR